MSREIKFRAWDKKNGYYADYEDIEEEITTQVITGWSSENGGVSFTLNYGIKDSEIEQYTGFKDKNGREIYEGDIVKYLNANYEVYFDKLQGWRGIRGGPYSALPIGVTVYKMTMSQVSRPEVIGNIHENPELSGGEE